MRIAFIGFSSPIGYSYKLDAPRTRNDASSSPNPVLYGATGLLTLYDELWFACESLCPASMRSLPYVKFLDAERPFKAEIHELDNVQALPDKLGLKSPLGLDDMFVDGFSPGMTRYLGGQFATDNHTHDLKVFGQTATGNPGLRQMALDLWLLNRNKDLNADLVFNPLTAPMSLGADGRSGVSHLRGLELAEGVLTLGSLYDLAGPAGPYHPSIEDLRGDKLIEDFRGWMDGQRNSLDNQELATVQADVDAKIGEFKERAIRDSVKRVSPIEMVIKIAKDALFDRIVPGASVLSSLSDAIGQNRRASTDRWKAFVALSRDKLDPGSRPG